MAKSLLSQLQDAGGEFASLGSETFISDVKEWVDTGSYALNSLLGGSIYAGLPIGRILTFGGEPATGKSFLSLSLCKSFLEKYSDGIVLYYESESALESTMIRTMMGEKNAKRFMFIPVSTLEQFRDLVSKMIAIQESQEKKTPIMCVLDSIGLLSSDSELKSVGEGKNTADLTKQRTAKSIFRVLTLRLAKAQIPLIICSHVYQSIGGYIPITVVAGGNAILYASSVVIHLTKSRERDTDGSVVGVNLKAKTMKSRLTKQDKMVEIGLSFTTGLDRFSGMADLAVASGIWKKLDKKIQLDNGEFLFESKIYAEPEKYFTPKVMEAIDIYCQMEFKYQSTGEVSESSETAVVETEETVEKKRRGRPPKEKS